jgi:hypothetical protein
MPSFSTVRPAGKCEATRRRHLGCRDFRRGEGSSSRGASLEELVADPTLENRLLKKSMIADGETRHEISLIRQD